MEKPRSPTLDQYGLTEDQYKKTKRGPFAFRTAEDLEEPMVKLALAFGAVGAAYTFWSTGEESSWNWVIALPLGLLLSLAGGFFTSMISMAVLMVLAKIGRWLELRAIAIWNPYFRRVKRFDRAMARYRKANAAYENWRARRQEKFWRSLSGYEFERELGNLFEQMGYKVQHTPKTGDGGVDLILSGKSGKTVVQCKAHNKKIGVGTARELTAVLRDFGAQQAILATLEG